MTEPAITLPSGCTKSGKLNGAGTLAAIGAMVCWTFGPIFLKYLTSYVDSWTQNALRYSVACLFWLPLLLLDVRRRKLDRRVWWIAVLPAVPNMIMQSFWAAGFYYLDAGLLTLLSKTSVLWIATFSLLFFADERPLVRSKRFWSALVLAAIGVGGVLYFKEDFAQRGTVTGIVLGLLMGLTWGVYTICAKIAFRDIDVRQGFSVTSLYTAVGLWGFALLFGRPTDSLAMGLSPWASVIFSAITAISLGHVLYYAAIKRIGATIPMLVALAQPFAVFAVSRVVFGESMNALQLLFGSVLLAGAAIAIWAQQHLKAGS